MTGIVNERDHKVYMDQRHLKLFEALCQSWAAYFGVSQRWEFYYSFGEDKNEIAGVHYKIIGRIATITLTNPYTDLRELDAAALSRAACHEIAHILLAPLADLAEDGALRGMNINDIEHEIVHTMVHNARAHIEADILERHHALIAEAFPPKPVDEFDSQVEWFQNGSR